VRPLRLRCLSGPRRDQEFISCGPRIRIGRSRDNDIILVESESPPSSGRHAEALIESGAWWIVDAGSTNGTYVNGVAIERCRLKNGDVLTFGNDQFVVAGGRRALWLTLAAAAALAAAGATAYTARHGTPVPVEQIAAAAAQSVYAIAIDDDGRRSIVGTAFAVDLAGILGTNAHIADALRRRNTLGKDSGPKAIAVRGDADEVRRVVGSVAHPDWRAGSVRADAALLQLDPGTPVAPLRIADAMRFGRLRRGMSLASFGFPAVSTDPVHPRGRLAVDVVGDVRGEFVEANLAIAPGTSGSPVFDDTGAVVAMVTSGDFVRGENGLMGPSGTAANWAISAARIRELLDARR
jgi:S1-C subfamily serine protease